jgi:hypothetical protein
MCYYWHVSPEKKKKNSFCKMVQTVQFSITPPIWDTEQGCITLCHPQTPNVSPLVNVQQSENSILHLQVDAAAPEIHFVNQRVVAFRQ